MHEFAVLLAAFAAHRGLEMLLVVLRVGLGAFVGWVEGWLEVGRRGVVFFCFFLVFD